MGVTAGQFFPIPMKQYFFIVGDLFSLLGTAGSGIAFDIMAGEAVVCCGGATLVVLVNCGGRDPA